MVVKEIVDIQSFRPQNFNVGDIASGLFHHFIGMGQDDEGLPELKALQDCGEVFGLDPLQLQGVENRQFMIQKFLAQGHLQG